MGDLGNVREIGGGRLLVDLGFRDTEGLIASYLIPGAGGEWTVVEAGPGSCRDALLEGVSRAGISPSEVRRVFVTHIHLDHAGGLGSLGDAFPNAQFLAHRAGVRHLVDPERLIASARRAWGEAADRLWGPVLPVRPDRLIALDGDERFPVAGGELRVLATPGHAAHHLSFFDTSTGALMTGDSAGVLLEGSTVARPALPPPDLDLDLLFGSLETMGSLEPRRLCYAHFGPVTGGAEQLRRYRRSVEAWRDAALVAARQDPRVESVARALRESGATAEDRSGRPESEREDLISGYDMAAMGLIRYFRTRGLLPETGG